MVAVTGRLFLASLTTPDTATNVATGAGVGFDLGVSISPPDSPEGWGNGLLFLGNLGTGVGVEEGVVGGV
ncbi:hypothetical protein GCM10028774_12280 [Spirosoma jeollabukense]